MLGDQDRVRIPLEPHPGAGLSKRFSVIRSPLGLQSKGLVKAHLARFSGTLFLCRERCLRRGQGAPRHWCTAHQRCARDGALVSADCAHNRKRGSADPAPSGSPVLYGHVLSDRPTNLAKIPVTYMAAKPTLCGYTRPLSGEPATTVPFRRLRLGPHQNLSAPPELTHLWRTHAHLPNMATTPFTSVGNSADSLEPPLRPLPATGYAAEILDG
jgi:hypothetical protein